MNQDLLRRIHAAIEGMWARRYEVEPGEVPEPPGGTTAFKTPGWVDLSMLAVVRQDFQDLLRQADPTLVTELLAFPSNTIDPSKVVLDFNEKRLRQEREFDGEAVAYVEAVWGRETFAVDFAVRDLELMRRGLDKTKTLRPPQTDYEAELIVRHVRDLANDIARSTGQAHLIRPEDDLRKPPSEGNPDE